MKYKLKWLHFDVIKIYTRTTLTRSEMRWAWDDASSVCRQTQKKHLQRAKIMIPPPTFSQLALALSLSLTFLLHLSFYAWSFYAALNFNQKMNSKKKTMTMMKVPPFYSTFPFLTHTSHSLNLSIFFLFEEQWTHLLCTYGIKKIRYCILMRRKNFMTQQMYRENFKFTSCVVSSVQKNANF